MTELTVPRFKVSGWTSGDPDEETHELHAHTPAEAGRALEELLHRGCWQLVVFDGLSPNRPSDN